MACLIPGCNNTGRHDFGVRLRRPSTRAIWAPNTNARLCDEHATRGVRLIIEVVPSNTGKVETSVSSPGGKTVNRTTKIRHKA